VVAGVGAVDGHPGGELVGDLVGDLAGEAGDGVAAGVGVDHVSLWRRDFTGEDASFGDSFQVRGARAGFS
jgi:hypothetical protein